ncbi:MAG: 2-dehydropantoate 2-reductase [Chitinophagaceae bacterium]|nr:2-dehydropantoate 2-reductase [Chitinophagaceae bacterium]
MENKGTAIKRIAILGIGGVGGYYGGKLAASYTSGSAIEVIFIARGENEKVIRTKGLELITPADHQIIHPKIITHDASEIGVVDLLICTTKAYALEESIKTILPCIDQHTIILPLLNGVNSKERIQQFIPNTNCWQGCTYIVTRLVEPGVVKETGIWNQLYFGDEQASEETIFQLQSIFTNAGINAKGTKEITPVIWSKFIFLSPIATMTTAFNLPIGAVLENKEHSRMLWLLIKEIADIGMFKGIRLPETIAADTLEKIKKLPFDTYSSMHFDYSQGKKTEVESLTGYVVSLGQQLGIETPCHDQTLALLKARVIF